MAIAFSPDMSWKTRLGRSRPLDNYARRRQSRDDAVLGASRRQDATDDNTRYAMVCGAAHISHQTGQKESIVKCRRPINQCTLAIKLCCHTVDWSPNWMMHAAMHNMSGIISIFRATGSVAFQVLQSVSYHIFVHYVIITRGSSIFKRLFTDGTCKDFLVAARFTHLEDYLGKNCTKEVRRC